MLYDNNCICPNKFVIQLLMNFLLIIDSVASLEPNFIKEH
jgi:hypothetical protein